MWWKVSGIVGALAVGLGAFGAHGLKAVITDTHLLEVWDTAARYHLIHAVALGLVAAHPDSPVWAGRLFCAGITLFSGSLYLMVLTDQRWLGAITPLGGLSLILGWLALAFTRSR